MIIFVNKYFHPDLSATSQMLSDLAFALARDIRQLDMEAAPYDLTAWGVDPVRIETAEGKAEYAQRQRGFSERASVLRERLISALEAVL